MSLVDRPVGTTPGEIERIDALIEAAFGRLAYLDRRFLTWCYAENPSGVVIGRNAWSGERIVAHYATIPLRARLLGKEAKGVLSLHTGTHPDFRGQGLFPRLAEATYADALELGHDFVVGVANAASTRGFTERLGFQLVAPLEVRVGLGAPPAGDPAADRDFARLWSPPELSWRLTSPNRWYRRTASEGGVVVYAPTGRLGIWAEVGRRPAEECTVGSALGRLSPLGVRNPVRLWLGLDATRSWKGQPWTPLPAAWRPSPLHLIYRDLREPGRRLDPTRVAFTALDFDAY